MKGIVQNFKTEMALWKAVYDDPRTPKRARWLIWAALGYALSPIDIIPDFIPVLGQLDDLIVLPLLIWLALRAVPGEIVEEHRARLKASGVRLQKEAGREEKVQVLSPKSQGKSGA